MTITRATLRGEASNPNKVAKKANEAKPMSEEKARALVDSLDNGLTLNRYQIDAAETAIYPGVGEGTETAFSYLFLKLNGEAGEAAEKYGKILRDKEGRGTEEDRQELLKEIGDVLWYCSQIVNELGSDLETVAQGNLDKLKSRADRGVLGGSGDNR